MNIQKRSTFLQLFALALVSVFGLGPAFAASDLMDRMKDDGLRVAFYNFAPYAYVNESNELVGTDVEILEAVLEKMGGKVGEAKATEWGALIPGVKTERFDVVAAGMFVTPKRCAEVRFSEPTFGIKQSFAVLKGNPHDIRNYESIRDMELKVGAVAGSAQVGYAETAGIASENIVQLPDNPTGVAALQAERIHAWAVSAPGVRQILKGTGGESVEASPLFDTVGGEPAVSHGAFAFRKEDSEFVNAFNETLTEFIGSDAHIAIMRKHDMTADELPIWSTSKICG